MIFIQIGATMRIRVYISAEEKKKIPKAWNKKKEEGEGEEAGTKVKNVVDQVTFCQLEA